MPKIRFTESESVSWVKTSNGKNIAKYIFRHKANLLSWNSSKPHGQNAHPYTNTQSPDSVLPPPPHPLPYLTVPSIHWLIDWLVSHWSNRKPQAKFAHCDSLWERPCFNSETLLCIGKWLRHILMCPKAGSHKELLIEKRTTKSYGW